MYPNLRNHFVLCFLDRAAEVLRDLGDLGEKLLGLTGDHLNEMAKAELIVIHPNLSTLGMGPSVKHNLSTFYLPLKVFLKGPSNLPQRFFYDELSPAWTQLAISTHESVSLEEPIILSHQSYRKLTELFPALTPKKSVAFTWKKDGGKRDQELKIAKAIRGRWNKGEPVSALYCVDPLSLLTRNCSRIPNDSRDKNSMAEKRYFDEFFATKFLPPELIKHNTPLHSVRIKINDLDRKFHPQHNND